VSGLGCAAPRPVQFLGNGFCELWYYPALLRFSKFALCLLFLAGLAFGCYRHPTDNLDRYIYEGILRSKSQSIDAAYSIVKHASPRAEESTTLDSPQHLRELEPLYAIRPLYLGAICIVGKIVPMQNAISLISAASFFGIGIVVLLWTKQPVLSGLLVAASPVLLLGRFGTPDALASVIVISALWLLDRERNLALGLLFVSLGVRTDNLLLLLAVLAWLAWERRLTPPIAAGLGLLGLAIVVGINHWAGNYGWVVLFRFTFIEGRYPAQIPHVLTLREYFRGFVSGAPVIVGRVAPWLLLGCLAWKLRPNQLLIVVGCATAAHFLLYPSPEDRYLVWAYVIAGIILIRSLDEVVKQRQSQRIS